MKKLTLKEFEKEMGWPLTEMCRDQYVNYPTAVGHVVFKNLQMDSSAHGQSAAAIVGPDQTFKSPEDCEGKWLNDLPSMRQYPIGWIPKEDLEGK